MTTRAPLFASIPHTALPQLTKQVSRQASVDELFDELDSDSGFSDDGQDGKVDSDDVDKLKEIEQDSTGQERHSKCNGSALLNAPSLFPDIQLDPSGPAWTKWTSSKVTCINTAYGTTEDKLDCIWLVAGCQDGSVWIFCSMSLTSSNTARTPRTDSMPNLLQHGQSRPSLSRKSSDTIARRAFPAAPRSPGSRVGSTSMAGSRSASAHGHSHTRKNRSISLALHNSPNLGTSPSAPRKASATISVSDFDATGNEHLNKDLPSPPRSPHPPSPSIHTTGRHSFAFEELIEPEQPAYDKVRFEPVVNVTLDAGHSPIVDIKLLPIEGNNACFTVLTENGRVFKLACQDGTLLQHVDIKRHCSSDVAIGNFSRATLSLGDGKALWFLCISKESGVTLPVHTSDLTVLPPKSFSPDSHLGLLQVASDTFLLEVRTDGHLHVEHMPAEGESGASSAERDAHNAGSVLLEDQAVCGLEVSNEDIIVWSESTVQILRLIDQKVHLQHTTQAVSPLKKVLCLSTRRLALISESFVQSVSMDAGSDPTALLDFTLSESIESATILNQPTSTDDCIVLSTKDDDGTRRICLAPMRSKEEEQDEGPDLHIAYSSSAPVPENKASVTASVRIGDDSYAIGYSSGQIAFCHMSTDSEEPLVEALPLSGAVTAMTLVDGEKSLLCVGSALGEMSIWDTKSRQEVTRHQLFAAPIQSTERTELGVLLIAADGAVALNRDQESPLVLPATRYPLDRIFYRQSQLLLVYSNGTARLWETDTGKMVKSLDHAGYNDLLAHVDGWQEIALTYNSTDALSMDLRKLVDSTATATSKGSKLAEDQLNPNIRWLLSRYCLPVKEEYVQTALRDHLQITLLPVSPSTMTSPASTSIFAEKGDFSSLTISQTATALRLLTIIALLRVFLNFPDTERYVNEVIAYYATQLGDVVGPEYKDASMDVLAKFWLDESNEIRQAARMLLGARIGRLSESEVMQEVQDRQARMLNSHTSDPQDLLILGEIAIAKQSMLSTGSIRNIAYQIAKSLSLSDAPASQSVGLELCIRGFSVFQNSFDAVKVLRDIFHLATSSSTLPTAVGLRSLARQAVLSTASVNAPLFMTVLSFDAVHDQADTEQRAKTLKLLAFMIRKKPVVLFSSLPRLVEMVVKSLDPRSTMRGALQQTATYILSDLVKTYPSIAFHGKTQRLAVGTHEGAVVVYDLKTATRLYILDSHKKRASALSYSTDGRRLVTVSLEESNVKVWKVGMSLLGLLTPAGPPPQGHGVSSNEAYKTLDFKLASPEEAMMTAAAQLEWLTVDWLEDRRVKITIRETALTFSVV